jgi:hypothetical protein
VRVGCYSMGRLNVKLKVKDKAARKVASFWVA